MAVKLRLKASSLAEVLVATLLIGIAFAAFMMTSGMLVRAPVNASSTQAIINIQNAILNAEHNDRPFPELYEINGMQVNVEIERHKEQDDLWIIKASSPERALFLQKIVRRP